MPRPSIAPDQPCGIFHSLQSRVVTLSLIIIHLQNIHFEGGKCVLKKENWKRKLQTREYKLMNRKKAY